MNQTGGWSADDSNTYRQLAGIAVPARAEQWAVLLCLLPFGQEETFQLVELAAGEGRLAQAILSAFPNATLLALDGEASMISEARARLSVFGDRAQVGHFDIMADDWYPQILGADVVLSSLCIHHLTAAQKRHLFEGVAAHLSPRGAFLIADLVAPVHPQAEHLFAESWSADALQQSLEQTGSRDLYDHFERERWNYYRYPDPFDKPSPLFEQLAWLQSAGFAVADCFWMRAGHAIYGGYQSLQTTTYPLLRFARAYEIARAALA